MWKKSWGVFVGAGLVTGLLPVMVWGVSSGTRTLFSTRAQTHELRLWWEPAEATLRIDQAMKFKLMANVESKNGIPALEMELDIPKGILVAPKIVRYGKLIGTSVVGEVDVVAVNQGDFLIGIIEDKVVTGYPDITIIASPVKIKVR